jgi:DNA-nicking Smr family endonuclease
LALADRSWRKMKRKLTEDERLIWAGAMRSVRPLRGGRAASEPPAALPPDKSDSQQGPTPGPTHLESRRAHRAVVTSIAAPAPISRRDKQRLARGRSPIDARLDLHGMTQAQAHAALARFLNRAQADGATFVLVITGTGARDPAGERGVLRRQVPLWLRLPDFRAYVLGFEPADVGHGGEGALYVRLRRRRG